jgi:SPP1 gp7 family putative phage head morphogenesis protein
MELGIPALPIDAIREAVYPSLRFGPNKETGLNLVSTWNKNSTDMLYKTQSAIMRGITMGQSYTKMAGSIKTEFDKGLWQAMRVVRTEAGRCWSEGAEKSHEAAIEAGLDVKKRWSAALDSRTRLSHARLDGTYADKDGLFWIGGEGQPQPRLFSDPAQSINCRCAVHDVLEGLEPSMRRIRDLEGDDGYSSEKAKSRIVPYQSFKEWAKPQGWNEETGWPKASLRGTR